MSPPILPDLQAQYSETFSPTLLMSSLDFTASFNKAEVNDTSLGDLLKVS